MISLRLSLAELRRHPTRLAAIVVSVTISVAFMVTSFGVVQTEFNHVGAQLGARYGDSDLVVSEYGTDPDELVAAVGSVPGVALVEPIWGSQVSLRGADATTTAELQSVSTEPRLRPASLGDGRWPSSSDEVVLDAGTAEALSLGTGAELELVGGPDQSAQPVQVVGLTDGGGGLLGSTQPLAYTLADWFTRSGDAELVPSSYLVLAEDGVDPAGLVAPTEQAVAAVSDSPGSEGGYSVDTTAQLVADTIEAISSGADVFTVLLLVFASIALLVGALIIANTFAIVIVQRRRQIGLLRAVGGSTTQLRRGLVLEALGIGLVGSLLGVALGTGVTALVAGLTGALASGLQLAVPAVLGSAAAGVLVTLLASLASIGRAAAIAPMEALRPVSTPAQGRRATVVRVVVCSVLALLGAGLSVLALTVATGEDGLPASAVLLLAIGGAATITLAVLGGARLYVPTLLRGVGQLNRLAGPVGRMANANMVRNPQRVAATCVALMLAVGLTVTLQVGAATAQRTLLADIEERYPVDVSLSDDSGTDIAPATVRELEQVQGVTASMVVSAVGATVGTDGSDGAAYHTLYGIDPVQADRYLPEPLPGLDDRSVVLSPGTGHESGDLVSVTVERYDEEGVPVSSDSTELTVRLSHGAHGSALVTRGTFAGLVGADNRAGLWLDVDPSADTQQVATDITTVLDAQDVYLADSGSLTESATYTQVLDTMVLIATALLGAAVLIALVGVGNTLGLSVIERTRESALMRALGLQRGQLRLMLLLEAVTLAVGGALVGVLAGCFFGWLGASALMAGLQQGPVQFALSWPQTLAVLGVAVVAAALASVLPGRRAALAAPTAALAAE